MAHKKKVLEIATQENKIDINPFTTQDGEKLQEMVNLNNTYSTLLKQQAQYDAAIFMLKVRRDQVVKGTLKLPVMIQVTRTMSYAEADKDKVLKHVDDEIKGFEVAKQGITGTLEYRRDAFVESLLRISKLLNEKTKPFEIKKIVGIRTGSKDVDESEIKVVEKELDQLVKQEKS